MINSLEEFIGSLLFLAGTVGLDAHKMVYRDETGETFGRLLGLAGAWCEVETRLEAGSLTLLLKV